MKRILFILLFVPMLGCGQNFFWSHSYAYQTVDVSTFSATAITDKSAELGGFISYSGNNTVYERGIVWTNSGTPTVYDNKVIMGSGTGSFSEVVSGFQCGNEVFVRAYAIVGENVHYGLITSFTLTPLNLPLRIIAYRVNSSCRYVNISSLATARDACDDWTNLNCYSKSTLGLNLRVSSIAVGEKIYSDTFVCSVVTSLNNQYFLVTGTEDDLVNKIIYVQNGVITYVEECHILIPK